MQDRMEIRELTDVFANLADGKHEDGVLEFQMGADGEVHEIKGRGAIVEAFRNTTGPDLLRANKSCGQILSGFWPQPLAFMEFMPLSGCGWHSDSFCKMNLRFSISVNYPSFSRSIILQFFFYLPALDFIQGRY